MALITAAREAGVSAGTLVLDKDESVEYFFDGVGHRDR